MLIPTVENSLLVMIDMQQKLLPVIDKNEQLIDKFTQLLRGACELNLDIAVTEQYPRGLGETVPELSTWLPEDTPVISKTTFSVFGEAAFTAALNARSRKVLIFCGVETHICLFQSVIDALQKNYEVIVVSDAVGSRKESDKNNAISELQKQGASVMSVESILFMLLRDAKHPAFKAISKLVK